MSFMEKLLDGVAVEWTLLEDGSFVEVANTARKPIKASLRVFGKTPYYGANNIQDYVDGYAHDSEYVLIAEDGSASLENYSIQCANGKFWANNHVHVVRGKQGLNTRFLYHYLRTVDFIPYLPNKGRAKLTKRGNGEDSPPHPLPRKPQKIASNPSRNRPYSGRLYRTDRPQKNSPHLEGCPKGWVVGRWSGRRWMMFVPRFLLAEMYLKTTLKVRHNQLTNTLIRSLQMQRMKKG